MTTPPIILFFHSLFFLGDPPELKNHALNVLEEQIMTMEQAGFLEECSEIIVGVNGGAESEPFARLFWPERAKFVFHGLESRGECRTIALLEEWVKAHPEKAFICYLHQKSSSHPPDSDYGNRVSTPWRRAMMHDLVTNWRRCFNDLASGFDIVCSRWLWNMADGTQHIPAGNMLWVTADFVRRLPSIFERERIKTSGINSIESRYEAEVYWGNGPRPKVKSYKPNGGGGIP